MFVELLRRTVKDIPLPEPSLPVGRTAKLPVHDIEHEKVQSQEIADTVGSALFIVYKNSKGELSERRISIKTAYRTSKGPIMIGAYCYERRAYRTFLADGIIEAVDLATGEVIDNKQAILECFGLVEKEHAADPKTGTRKVLRQCRDSLNVLVYMARCDGVFHHDEENIVIHYLMDKFFDCEFDNEYLLTHIRRLYPDTDAFFDSLDAIKSKTPDELKKLGRYVAQLVQADGSIMQKEQDFLSELAAYTEV